MRNADIVKYCSTMVGLIEGKDIVGDRAEGQSAEDPHRNGPSASVSRPFILNSWVQKCRSAPYIQG